jgi:hypothetical protein
LVPNERLRYTDKFDDPNLPGDIQVTVTLKNVSVGTELNIVQEGLPDMIPPEACYLGWQERSLRLLASLVAPTPGSWAYGTPYAAGLRKALRQAAEERFCRCRGNPRSSN